MTNDTTNQPRKRGRRPLPPEARLRTTHIRVYLHQRTFETIRAEADRRRMQGEDASDSSVARELIEEALRAREAIAKAPGEEARRGLTLPADTT